MNGSIMIDAADLADIPPGTEVSISVALGVMTYRVGSGVSDPRPVSTERDVVLTALREAIDRNNSPKEAST